MSKLVTTIGPIPGFKVAGVSCGIRKSGRPDLALIVGDGPCAAAGVFTTNRVKAAPVLLDQERLARNAGRVRAVVANSGVANACTGEQGMQDAEAMARHAADALGCPPQDVLVMSTGVIGVTLPMDRIAQGVRHAAAALRPDAWEDAARAIMTTDTRPKLASLRVETPAGAYTIAGIAKGAGMIAPHMATMLAVLVTDAALEPPTLRRALQAANAVSFNQIVVDGDMSTNDTVLALASGRSGVRVAEGAGLEAFQAALAEVCAALARMLVRDGEGATRFITLRVTGAPDAQSARQVAMAIATSPLVKTAFYGGDANWGRILAAAGRAGVPLDADKLRLWFAPGEDGTDSGVQVVAGGAPTAYREEEAAAALAGEAVSVRLDLGLGQAESTVWTCDLSHDYVTINGHYRT